MIIREASVQLPTGRMMQEGVGRLPSQIHYVPVARRDWSDSSSYRSEQSDTVGSPVEYLDLFVTYWSDGIPSAVHVSFTSYTIHLCWRALMCLHTLENFKRSPFHVPRTKTPANGDCAICKEDLAVYSFTVVIEIRGVAIFCSCKQEILIKKLST